MTRKSSRDEMKKRRGYASNIYTELILEAPKDLNSHVVIAPRDMEQVRNAQRSARRQLRMTHETSCNLQVFQTNLYLLCIIYMHAVWNLFFRSINIADSHQN